jgi:cellobiose transport system substrate-binding protein
MGVTLRRRSLAAVAILATAALGLVACSKSSDTTGSNSTEKITLNVDVFGNFGYEELYKQYMQEHPNISIVERGTGGQLGDYTQQVTQRLAAGSGLGDVIAVEEGMSIDIKAKAANFVDLNQYGAKDLASKFLDWKFKWMQTDDGKTIGLGTDVGGMAMCYRSDLFKKAGLPTDRDAVSKLWPTWDDYINVGKQFKAKVKDAGFIDAVTNTYNTILMQEAGNTTGYTYFDQQGNYVAESNPAVKTAWDKSVQILDAGLSAKLQAWTDGWNNGFKNAKFATIACPAWMTGYITSQNGDAGKGKWDIAKVPGNGGNWGGSWLSVPKQSKHPKEAAELAKFLTSPAGQIAAFKSKGNLPSSPEALDDPAVKAAVNEYFSNAPTGQIYAEGAKLLKPVYLGKNNVPVRTAVENALRTVEQGTRKSDAAWAAAVADGKKAA